MISTFTTVTEPSQLAVGFAIGLLLTLLVASQLLDYEGSPLRSAVRLFKPFSTTLLVLFILVVVVRVFQSLV